MAEWAVFGRSSAWAGLTGEVTMKVSALLVFFIVFCGVACQEPLPCTDCSEGEDLDDDDDSKPDLPCGGADLSSDNSNCGECGNVCEFVAVDPQWEAGRCVDGECTPSWTSCVPSLEVNPITCSEVCNAYDKICMPRQCVGATALLFAGIGGQGCFDPPDPFFAFEGDCDADIPGVAPEPGLGIYATCCCL